MQHALRFCIQWLQSFYEMIHRFMSSKRGISHLYVLRMLWDTFFPLLSSSTSRLTTIICDVNIADTAQNLKAFIISRFVTKRGGKYLPGHEKVAAGDYEIFDTVDPQRTITKEIYSTLAPGHAITMAVIVGRYSSPFSIQSICPRPDCNSRSIQPHRHGDLCW